jgi:spore coat polysaccharide biosynthesis protein SpsF (cytidylyltransferase family)
MKTVAIIQARIRSERLPGKVLYELGGRPLIAIMIERVRRAKSIDEILLATGDDPANHVLVGLARDLGVTAFKGSERDVLARFAGAAQSVQADRIVRLTGDCPFSDPDIIESLLDLQANDNLDYCCNMLPPSWPDGLDVSVFTRAVLEQANSEAALSSEREHVVPWIWKNCSIRGNDRFKAINLACPESLSSERWTIDDPADYLMFRSLCATIGTDRLIHASWREILDVMRNRPQIGAINAGIERDAGLARSVAQDNAGDSDVS